MSWTTPDLPSWGDVATGALDWTQGISIPPFIEEFIGWFWDPATKEVGGIMNHALEERSYIDFHFPNKDIGRAGRRRICFFQNPEIVESRAPNYAVTPIVQRNEPARLYMGSQARKVSVSFTHTFPHLVDFAFACQARLGAGFDGHERHMFEEWIKKAVTTQIAGAAAGSGGTSSTYPVESQPEGGVKFRPNVMGQGPRWVVPPHYEANGDWPEEITFPGAGNKSNADMLGQLLDNAYGFRHNDYGVLAAAYIHYTMDTIRASVVGDYDEKLSAGPPLVRLNHGTSFLGEPFVVTNYQIEFDNLAGTDPRTLIPRQVKFRLSLEEVRQSRGFSTQKLPGSSDIMHLGGDGGLSLEGDRLRQVQIGGRQSEGNRG